MTSWSEAIQENIWKKVLKTRTDPNKNSGDSSVTFTEYNT